ncbi:hypothetical protein WJX72_012244 [[Myrmecia] bisecta]|uniref:Uncharacterized protein n=1 Tax=[Myrmecia] bisecta TaxID=41462 RepID=A0AAW1PQ29_9CHLO
MQGGVAGVFNLLNPRSLNSAVYSFMGLNFLLAGFSYAAAPEQTLAAIFGTAGLNRGVDTLVWKLIGVSMLTLLPAAVHTVKEAIESGRLALPKPRNLNWLLATAGLGNIAALYPIYASGGLAPDDQPSPIFLALIANWGAVVGASVMEIAISWRAER